MIVRRAGPVFSSTARSGVNGLVDTGLQKAQAHLLAAIQGKATVKTGQLRACIKPGGEQMRRTVKADLRRAVPIEFGWLPASIRAKVRSIRAIGGRGSRKRARALMAGKVPGKRFFYATFKALKATLAAQYLAPVGAAIVKSLS
jgi:hypothetical protein